MMKHERICCGRRSSIPTTLKLITTSAIFERDTGQLNAAIDQYRKALSLKPNFAEAYSNLGCVLADLERRNEAMESYRKAIELAPDNALTYNNIAMLYREIGKYSEAIEYSQKALALKPDFADPYITLGNALGPSGEICRRDFGLSRGT